LLTTLGHHTDYRKQFWIRVSEAGLGLITKKEAPEINVEDMEANAFFDFLKPDVSNAALELDPNVEEDDTEALMAEL